jgi:hypothetical protein
MRRALIVVLMLHAASARGGPPPEAVKLFGECMAAVEGRHLAEARACFERVHALYPSAVVLCNLARTQELLDQVTEAFTTYQSCLGGSADSLTPRERTEMQRRRQALRARLALVRLRTEVPGVRVFIDGTERGAPSADLVPLTPGRHRIVVEAADHAPWRSDALVVAGEEREFRPVLRRLAALESPEGSAGPAADEARPLTARLRIGAIVLAGVGVAAVAMGVATVLSARAFNEDALKHCDTTHRYCDPTGLDLTRKAESRATAATVGFAVAGAAFVSTLTLELIFRRQRARRASAKLTLAPTVTSGGAGLLVWGALP